MNGVLGGAIVIIAIINEAVGIVAVMLCYFFVNRLGRRNSVDCYFVRFV